jgi:hypothetical protein
MWQPEKEPEPPTVTASAGGVEWKMTTGMIRSSCSRCPSAAAEISGNGVHYAFKRIGSSNH